METFGPEVGLGQVRAEDGLLFPFHCTEIVDGSRTIAVGTEVRFVVAPGQLGIWEARAVVAGVGGNRDLEAGRDDLQEADGKFFDADEGKGGEGQHPEGDNGRPGAAGAGPRSSADCRLAPAMRQDGIVMNNPSDNEPQLVVVQGPSGPAAAAAGQPAGDDRETVELPAKVMRIGSMIRQLLEEVRQAPLDEASRIRLRQVYDTSLRELQEGLSPDLSEELSRMAPPFHPERVPTDSELRVAQAQLVGWLEGLFHGIQATLFAQQMAQRAQMEEAKRRGLPMGQFGAPESEDRPMPGNYL